MSYFLGVDIGTSGTKTLLIDANGTILAEANKTYGLSHPKPLWSEQNPEDWWDATVATIRSVLRKSKVKKAEVKAIGLSCLLYTSPSPRDRG